MADLLAVPVVVLAVVGPHPCARALRHRGPPHRHPGARVLRRGVGDGSRSAK
ncbi:hypothetical protein KCH_04810 [Kitasatospora cheerisanensis KCTC 2395]|uniref:Uncharacterized protein n=1 Tax=Kitasatospora cheerisanensis KCTC 2395 TaxID=1348663 RepID=A0A066Z6G8_9ACTN|nr:hypothetical protein KCH_04810 [Kitasatospora cheerisanensis KCTC 2395]